MEMYDVIRDRATKIIPSTFVSLDLPFSERRFFLVLGDGAVLLLAAIAAILLDQVLQGGGNLPVLWTYQELWLLVLIAAWLLFTLVNDGYDLEWSAQPGKVIRGLLFTVGEVALLYLLIFFIFGRQITLTGVSFAEIDPPRLTPLLFLLVAFPFCYVWRLSYIVFFTTPTLRRRILVVGAGHAERALVQRIRQTSQHYQVVGFIDDDPLKQHTYHEDIPILGTHQDLAYQIDKTGAREIILAVTHDIHTDMLRSLMACYERGTPIKPLTVFYSEVLGRVPVEHLGQRWVSLPFWGDTPMPTVYRVATRLMDILVSLVGLFILVLFLPFIAASIYLDNPGPIFYTQRRMGCGGKIFYLIKFRSMVTNAEQHGKAVWASKGDPRITRVGRFLRRTRIDELPQLINVLLGEMSIVGPRPERPEFVEQLEQHIPFYRARLRVKPGITGWAQIKYRYGNTVEDSLTKLEYDLYYIKHRSFLLDVLIMLRTARIMLELQGT